MELYIFHQLIGGRLNQGRYEGLGR